MDNQDRFLRDDRLDFVGRGWAFPVGLDVHGRIGLTTGTEAIERAIKLILQTVVGARVMRPEFGSELHSLVFAENNATTAGMADFYVRRALARWERRIEIDDVRITWEDADQGAMTINLAYRVKATNDRRNLVFPFYSIQPEE